MQDQQPRRPIPFALLAGLSVLVLTTGSAVAWWTWTTHSQNNGEQKALTSPQHSTPGDEGQSSVPKVGEPTNSQNTQANGAPTAEEKILQVYWLKPTGNTIELAPLTLKLSASNNSQALLDAALNKLLAGPTDPSAVTTIPQGTSLRSVTIKQDGVHVDLSKEFTSGGGSTSMIGRLGQVIYTATSLNPNTPVWISVEGKSLKTLGGEGLVLEQPLTRDRYQKDFPR